MKNTNNNNNRIIRYMNMLYMNDVICVYTVININFNLDIIILKSFIVDNRFFCIDYKLNINSIM